MHAEARPWSSPPASLGRAAPDAQSPMPNTASESLKALELGLGHLDNSTRIRTLDAALSRFRRFK
eukprot:375347-Alexandrium_andersonii.AAC.1